MNPRPVVRTHHFDFDRARRSLRDRVVSHERDLGATCVRVRPEPLLAHGRDGGLLQSVRLEGGGLDTDAKIEVRDADGRPVACELRDAPDGVRVLVPEVATPTELTLELIDLGISVPAALHPQRHWDVHLVHHSHLDIGYTDPQNTVIGEHLSFLDSASDLVRQTGDWPDDARFRWTVEALWAFDLWRERRPDAVVEAFVDQVRAGSIELTALPFNMHTETCSTTELHEFLRLVHDVRDRYGVEIPAAMQTDVPGAVAGLVDALAENGVRYLSVAHNWAGRSVPHLTGGDRVPRLFRWASPSGNSVLVWVTDTPHGLSYMEGPMLGFDRSYAMVDDLLPAYLTSLATHPYPYDGSIVGWACADAPLDREPYPWDLLHLRVQGRFGDNAPPRRVIAETVRRWNETWAFPHLRMSTNTAFFAEAEARYGGELPTYEGDWNDWWADGIGSAARPMQLVRRAQRTVAQAGTLSAIAGLCGAPDVGADTAAARRVHRDALLFDEHTWGAGNPWTYSTAGFDSGEEQWHWKYATALAAQGGADAVLERAAARLGAVRTTAAGALASFDVVNTAGRDRGGIVRAFLPESRVPQEVPVQVRDARTGQVLPVEEVPQDNPTHRDAGRHLLVAVADIPAVGTVRLDVHPAAPTTPTDGGAAPTDDTVLTNGLVQVELDARRSGIASIRDLTTGRELVEHDATFAFNAYVYDRYVSGGGLNHASGRLESDIDLNMLGTRSVAHPAAIVDRGRSAVRDWVVYESVADGARSVRTTITLWHGQARVDIENRIAKDPVQDKESGYFAFPFAVADPTVRYEISGAVAGDGITRVPGGAEHMHAVRRWVSLQDDDGTVAWVTRDAPLVQLGDIAVPYPPFPGTTTAIEPATVYSWVHNNIWDTNFPSGQAFDVAFAYSVAIGASGDGDHGPDAGATLGVRTAQDVDAPLLAVLAAPVVDASLDASSAASTSWLTLDDDRVELVGLEAADDGAVLVRLQSVAEGRVQLGVRSAVPIRGGRLSTYLGDPLDDLAVEPGDDGSGAVTVDVPPYSTAAVLVHLDPGERART